MSKQLLILFGVLLFATNSFNQDTLISKKMFWDIGSVEINSRGQMDLDSIFWIIYNESVDSVMIVVTDARVKSASQYLGKPRATSIHDYYISKSEDIVFIPIGQVVFFDPDEVKKSKSKDIGYNVMFIYW